MEKEAEEEWVNVHVTDMTKTTTISGYEINRHGVDKKTFDAFMEKRNNHSKQEKVDEVSEDKTEIVKSEPLKVRQFETGAVRDTKEGKENYIEGISYLALKRLAQHMDRCAVKYGCGNWQKGIPSGDYIESFGRHWQKFLCEWEYGICVEKYDHLAAIAFNLFGLIHELELYKYGKGRCYVSENYKRLYPNEGNNNLVEKSQDQE